MNYLKAKQAMANLINSNEIANIDDVELLRKIANDKSMENDARAIRLNSEREFYKLADELGVDPKVCGMPTVRRRV